MESETNSTKVLAIVGLPGSGKTQAIEFLQNQYNLENVYLGQVTFDELDRQNLKVTNDNERKVREELRSKYGMSAYAKLSLDKIKDKEKTGKLVLIESLYSWEEYKIIKEEYQDQFKVLAILATPETRFERLKHRPQRPITTPKEFKKRDFSQIENLHQGGPIAKADRFLINEGNINDLHKELEKIITKL